MTSLSTAVFKILEDIQDCVFKISKKPKKPPRQVFLSSFNIQNLNVTKLGAPECKGTCGLVPNNISIRGERGRLRPTHRLFPTSFFYIPAPLSRNLLMKKGSEGVRTQKGQQILCQRFKYRNK